MQGERMTGCGFRSLHELTLGLHVPSEKVFGVGARRVQIPNHHVFFVPRIFHYLEPQSTSEHGYKYLLWAMSHFLEYCAGSSI